MYTSNRDRYYSPASSPPSSPGGTGWVDSSPANSSPTLDHLYLDSEPDIDLELPPPAHFRAPIDPLAGSYNSNRGKRTSCGTLSPPRTPVKKPRLARSCNLLPTSDTSQSTLINHSEPVGDREDKVWEEAGNMAFENGCCNIELMNHGLTRIPSQFLKDLNKIVILPEISTIFDGKQDSLTSKTDATTSRRTFTRAYTAPATTAASLHLFHPRGKTTSGNSLMNGTSRETVQLFLSQNTISKLPLELWSLQNLTILSLRNNFISYLPPEIAKLKNLKSLNVAYNRLTFVPSELFTMKLQEICLHPNPFISEPTTSLNPARPISEKHQTAPRVLPLTELALRVLLAQSPQLSLSPSTLFTPRKDEPQTVLESMYELPLATGASWRPISIPLRQILSVCVPRSILADELLPTSLDGSNEDETMRVTGIGVCPNPKHEQTQIFVRHAEQRFTWEPTIAGTSSGGQVPVRWRGCQQGCLDFLEPPEDVSDDGDLVQTVCFDGPGLAEFDDE
ncbi:hypothetical protein B0H34DRAFT_412508 [Crassisporium funariophilum]|nr:hypothetical protein B0H34DRAFT_412508 [Crassisporium funariophilum]